MIVRIILRFAMYTMAAAVVAIVGPAMLQAQEQSAPYMEFRKVIAPASDRALSDLPPELILEMATRLDALRLEYPDSNLALQIMLGEKVDGIDLGELKRLADAAASTEKPVASSVVASEPLPSEGGPSATDTGSEAETNVALAGSTASINSSKLKEDSPNVVAAGSVTVEEAAASISTLTSDNETAATAVAPLTPSPLLTVDNPSEPIVFANLPAAVTACLSIGLLPSLELQLQLEVDANGQLVGVPQILNQDQSAQGLREAYLKALVALDDCTPLRSEGGAGTVIALLAPDGMVTAKLQLSEEVQQEAPADGLEDNASTEVIQVPEQAVISPADEATETKLGLNEQAWRDVQARLLVLGHDPNGVDGEPGRGTRQAITFWQSSVGLPASGYLSAEQLARLSASSQVELDRWLQDPANKALHTPPPPVELTARAVNGDWFFSATCGRNSAFPGQTITGILSLTLGGGQSVRGTIRNSQGLTGRVNGRLDGRRMSGTINWGLLLGRVTFSGRIASQSLSYSGDDSNGCRIRARKG